MSKNKQRKAKPIRKRPIPESLQGQVYLDPRYDTGFKELFDSESALKDFLDELLTRQEKDMVTREEIDTIIASGIRRGTEKACAEACAKASAEGRAEGRAEGLAKGLAKGLTKGRAEGIDILESLGVPANLIEKARKIVAEKAKESPGKP